MKTLRSTLAWPLAFAFLLIGCSGERSRLNKAASKGDEIVEAEGLAPYYASDLPATKAASLAAAQKAAVELVVGVYVNARIRVEKAVAIESKILTKTQGYVKKYSIMNEGQDGQWYKTRIRALVSTHVIHEDLEDLGVFKEPAVNSPRVIVFLQEWIGENKDDMGHASRVLTQGLLNRGFKVAPLPSGIKTDEDPVEIAKSLNPRIADLILAGIARAQSLGYGKEFGGMSSYRASVSFRALQLGTGDVLYTVSQTASGIEATSELAGGKALENAAEAAAKELNALPQELAKRTHVSLTITGLKSFEKLAQFQKGLSALSGVKEYFLRSYEQESGAAAFDLQTNGMSAQDVADQCVRIGGPEWSVYQVAGYSIQLLASQAGR